MLHVLRHHASHGEHERLLVCGKLPGDITVIGQEAVHAGIVAVGEEIGRVCVDKMQDGLHLLHVYLCGYGLSQARGVVLCYNGGKSINGLHQTVGCRFFCVSTREEGYDATTPGVLLIGFQGLAVFAAEGEEVGDVLLVSLTGKQDTSP